MATSTSTINFGGLASGLDTNTIVDQLMAIEAKGQTRLKLRQQQIDTRKSALSDVESRLKNLQLAAQDLKSPTLWLDTQTVDVNDSTKVAATRTGGAGTGGYQVAVTQLAGAYQHWYKYTAPAADETFTVAGKSYALTAGSDLNAAAGAINSDSGSTVYASAVTAADGTKYLALSAKKTGSDALYDFSLAGNAAVFNADPAKDVTGANAQGHVGSQAFDEPTNTIADMIPGVSLTLKGVTGATPVTVTV
ncbi:MAG: flagellar hook-associated protein 2, partial [Thermoleophilaceae bacterium]|nr:flagellar hook-associated protein 2 [Thermoleophilaceae bacterium]